MKKNTASVFFALSLLYRRILIYSENNGRIKVLSIKVALATMCAGKLMDKLRCEYDFLEKCFVLKYVKLLEVIFV